MMRFALACSLIVGSLSSVALADRVAPAPYRSEPAPHFAQPPGAPVQRTEAEPVDDGGEQLVLDRDHVRTALAAARARSIAAFEAYAARGIYPSNTFSEDLANVWRDRDGHLCAAATIIDASGAHALVQRVAEQTNFIKLGEVKQGPLMDWILTSGLTQDEIALIQRPFMPVAKPARPVETDKRVAETARLKKLYAQIDKTLAANGRKSLDLATDRLLNHQQLAWQLLAAR
jgi:hypothetical protein